MQQEDIVWLVTIVLVADVRLSVLPTAVRRVKDVWNWILSKEEVMMSTEPLSLVHVVRTEIPPVNCTSRFYGELAGIRVSAMEENDIL